jgi:gamma-glutamyltranspeptidase/glutathione hydrolase
MVASDDPIANEWGAEILRKGGNAVDAAVATAFTLAVTRPHYGSLGGGGFIVYCPKKDGAAAPECFAVDYRERAPKAAGGDMYNRNGKPDTSLAQAGALASGVPGVTAGLTLAHSKWGKLPLRELLRKPIELARGGVRVTGWLEWVLAVRWKDMNSEARQVFGCSGQPCPAGTLLKQPDLARLLAAIARDGARAFYEGESARRLARGVRDAGGILSEEDLEGYHATVRKPVTGTYKGLEVISMPPPSAGGTMVVELLGYFERAERQGALAQGFGAASSLHAVAHALALSFADRAELFGDPDFVPVPLARLTSNEYLDERWKSFDPGHAAIPVKPGLSLEPEGKDTTHLSVLDREGGAVALTTTLNLPLGSGFIPPGTGVVMNDEMDDFSLRPGVANVFGLVGSRANAIAPGKRPLSSMSPTIVRDRAGSVRLVIGAQGGPRITSSVAQVILNRFGFGVALPDSVAAPRIHEQWKPPALKYDTPGISEDTVAKLRALGYSVVPEERSDIARIHAIERFPNGRVWGVADPRGEGNAVAE